MQIRGLAKLIWDQVLQINFYRAHLTFFVVTILVSSAIFWASNTDGYHVDYTDALFMCTSAMTSAGLTTFNMSSINGYQQSIMFVLMALGDLSTASISVVFVRRYFFGRKINKLLQHSEAARRLAKDIEEQRNNRHAESSRRHHQTEDLANDRGQPNVEDRDSDQHKLISSRTNQADRNGIRRRPRRTHHGYGGVPAPWETRAFNWVADLPSRMKSEKHMKLDHHYLSFSPELDNRGRFRDLTNAQLAELGGVEYRALGVLTWFLPAYTLFWLCLSWVIIAPYTTRSYVSDTIRTVQPGNTNPTWWAFFIGLSAYSNTGLSILDQNMIPFAHDYLILIITGAVILAGNTFYPIFLRLFIWIGSKVVPKHSALHHSFAFLLHHPRRCFLFLFPSKNTWYLFGVQIVIFLLLWLAFEVLNLGYTPLTSQFNSGAQRVMDGLYQAHGVRSSGFYITNQSNLSPSCQIFFMVGMYVSAVPSIISLRSSNIYEERSVGIEDLDGRHPEKPEDTEVEDGSGNANDNGNNNDKKSNQGGGPNIRLHIKNQLAYDLWWIILAVFLITIIERDPLAALSPGYSIFSIIFEVVSAYGTVGLSLGLPDADYSFCGVWHVLSKLILITVMIRGRHRILPLAVDRAVLLPGQKLMERFDREDMLHRGENSSEAWQGCEDEIRKEEEGEQAERGGQQDPESSGSSARDREADSSSVRRKTTSSDTSH